MPLLRPPCCVWKRQKMLPLHCRTALAALLLSCYFVDAQVKPACTKHDLCVGTGPGPPSARALALPPLASADLALAPSRSLRRLSQSPSSWQSAFPTPRAASPRCHPRLLIPCTFRSLFLQPLLQRRRKHNVHRQPALHVLCVLRQHGHGRECHPNLRGRNLQRKLQYRLLH